MTHDMSKAPVMSWPWGESGAEGWKWVHLRLPSRVRACLLYSPGYWTNASDSNESFSLPRFLMSQSQTCQKKNAQKPKSGSQWLLYLVFPACLLNAGGWGESRSSCELHSSDSRNVILPDLTWKIPPVWECIKVGTVEGGHQLISDRCWTPTSWIDRPQ